MTRVLATARKELAVLWLSPVPYVVGALFNLVVGVLFVNQLALRRQALAQPLFPVAGFLLVAAVPVVTMRSLADEARTGSLDLLGAVPVPGAVLAVGKWLATWATCLAVVVPTGAFIALVALWGSPDPGPVIAGMAGLALMAGALAALGVLASASSASQAVAAMGGFFVGLLLWFAHAGDEAVGVGGALAHLSLSERLHGFASGLVDTADVAFYVVLAAGALVLASALVDWRRAP